MTKLRGYQATMVDQIEAATGSVLCVMPTGAGKTVVAAAIIERAAKVGRRVLVVTHRREILAQTSFNVPLDHGLIQAGLNVEPELPIQIASIQTLWARCVRTDKMPLPSAHVLIVDEAHRVAAATWRGILENYPNAKLVGLTATPCRSDGRGLGSYFDRVVEGPQIPDLIALGHLVRTVYYTPAQPDLRGVETRQGDYVIKQLADRMNREDLVGDIVSNWHRHGQRRQTLVFCVDVAHSVHVKNEFMASGVGAEHLDGTTPREERQCQVLTEGFDLPAIGCIVLARPTKQLGLFRQMAGRGLRPAPGKSNLILIDHSGAVYRHGLLEDRIEWTLEVTERAENPTHAARSRQTTSRLIECTQCAALRTAGEPCPLCGFLPKRRPDAIVFREGELGRVDRGRRSAVVYSDPAERMLWHGMLTHIALERGYKAGWAAHKYKEKFGHWPPANTAPIPPSPEVLSWVRSRMIAYAKARGAA